jgi:hypothetical protein
MAKIDGYARATDNARGWCSAARGSWRGHALSSPQRYPSDREVASAQSTLVLGAPYVDVDDRERV